MSFFSNLSGLFKRANQKQTDKQKPEEDYQKYKKPKHQHRPQKQEKNQRKQVKQQQKSQQEAKKEIFVQPSEAQKKQIQQQVDTALREAKAQAREIVVEAKDKALQIKANAEQSARQQELELSKRERTLDQKIDKLDRKLDRLEQKEKKIEEDQQRAEDLKQKLKDTEAKMLARLEEISGMTEQEARQVLLNGLENKLTKEMAQMIRQRTEEAEQEAREKAKELIIDSMRHGATDYVSEYTVSVVEIPSQDVKGKIIGKSGRNIHAFERETGVDLDLDYSDKEVRLSCFDPVRREIARISLEALIKDGRIQPARIEKTVRKVKKEIDDTVFEAGKDLCQRAGVYNLPNQLIKQLGRFKFRFSYGQNLISHTLEVTKIGTKLAKELGLDVNTVKLGCLLHDIGKVADTAEGSHVELGLKMLQKYNIPKAVIDCVEQHHQDVPFSSPESMVVYVADAVSGARPGARYENFEEYIERLEGIENIATSHSEVKEAYAVKAGREVRVLLDPEKSKENDVTVLANNIKERIQEELTYPGTVTVNVIREVRAQATAN